MTLNEAGKKYPGVQTISFADTPTLIDRLTGLTKGADDTCESWRAKHRRYHRPLSIFAQDRELIRERFAMVEDFGA
ncbi:hypothetical protein [uncultured Sulfitobacter sp.]|uniref:hypothetical protein n=1 Tax=uncultured Sulfitobacter sp. TaxID=191468 RepID=UPI002638D04B|nr:hypothetical protein [uncultured Sulfitobacter sp.]